MILQQLLDITEFFDYDMNKIINVFYEISNLEKKYDIEVFDDYNTSRNTYDLYDFNPEAFLCGASKGNIVIGADKRIYPCSLVEEELTKRGYKCPTIDEMSFYDAFHFSEQFEFFKNNSFSEICSLCYPFHGILCNLLRHTRKKDKIKIDCYLNKEKCIMNNVGLFSDILERK